MAISKANFNSFNVTPTASKFITFNSSNNGLAADDIGGNLKLLSTQTASDSASLTFTSGIDSTHKEYIFKLINIHPASDNAELEINFSVDSGSNYNVNKTAASFIAQHQESGSNNYFTYDAGADKNNDTSDHVIHENVGGDADECVCAIVHLFDPSSTTFIKHYTVTTTSANGEPNNTSTRISGYGNTTSAIDAVKFEFTSGNIESGVIKMYGVL